MIVLVKLFNKESYKDGTEYGAAKPFAIYEENSFKLLNTNEDYIKYFPNSGNIFVPYKNNREQIFALHQVSESISFEPDRPNSNKFVLNKEVLSSSLFELVDLYYSFETDYETISNNLSKGFSFDYPPNNEVVFRTKDGYLIGPVKLIENEGIYELKNNGFVPFYKSKVSTVTIFDDLIRKNRTFFVNEFEEMEKKGNIDLADDRAILSFVLQYLKSNTELGEMSRKIKQQLSSWLTAPTIEEKYIHERFKKVVKLIDTQNLDQEFLKKFTENLLSLDLTKEIIENATSQKFEEEYKKFVKVNKTLINETNSNKILFQDYANKVSITEKKLVEAKQLLTKIEKTFQKKIQDLQMDFSKVYAEELANASIDIKPVVENNLKPSNQCLNYELSSKKGIQFHSLPEVIESLKLNLKRFNSRDPKNLLISTIFSSIKNEQPLIIMGRYSLELAHCLSTSVTSYETLTIIPELETFGLNQLESLFSKYECEKNVKTLILHNLHLTSAQYTLPGLIKRLKWSNSNLTPDLYIYTVDNEEGAEELQRMLGEVPLIHANDFIDKFIKKSQISQLTTGQITKEDIESFVTFDKIRGLSKEYKNWYVDNNDEVDEIELSEEHIEWLEKYVNILGHENGYLVFSKIFDKYLTLNSDEV